MEGEERVEVIRALVRVGESLSNTKSGLATEDVKFLLSELDRLREENGEMLNLLKHFAYTGPYYDLADNPDYYRSWESVRELTIQFLRKKEPPDANQ